MRAFSPSRSPFQLVLLMALVAGNLAVFTPARAFGGGFETGFRGATDAGVADEPGRYYSLEGVANFDADGSVLDSFFAGIGLKGEFRLYEFTGSPTLGQPFDGLFTAEFYGWSAVKLDEDRTAFISGGGVTLGFAERANVFDAFNGWLFAGAEFWPAENFRLKLGLHMFFTLRRTAPWPLIDIQWDIAPDLRLHFDGWTLRMMFLPKFPDTDWALTADAGLDVRQYRLGNGGPSPNGVLVISRVPVAIGGEWHGTSVMLRLRVGVRVFEQLDWYTPNGRDLVREIQANVAVFTEISFRLDF